MKKILLLTVLVISAVGIFISCKKENSCEGCQEGNKPPIAIAGPDQVITLPTDSVSLDGTASADPDGMISDWLWTKISGPASFTLVNAITAIINLKNLDSGSYQFELMVTDDKGLTAKDTMRVTVSEPRSPNRPPVANAGPDQTLVLPVNTTELDGRASTDPDNNITGYTWSKISGPASFSLAISNAVQSQVNNLIEGVYQFEMKVTDAGGLFDFDTVHVSVIAQTPPPNLDCSSGNRAFIDGRLSPIGNLSLARTGMAAISSGNKIFFAGGYNDAGGSSRVDIYDLVSDSWSTADLSVPRSHIAVVALGNKVFFAGGLVHVNWGNHVISSQVDIYDLITNTWSTSLLSEARWSIAAAAVGDKIFFAGGYNGSAATARVDIYNLTTQNWSVASLSEARMGLMGITADNRIYFAGGWSQWGVDLISNKIDIYDYVTDSWSTSVLNTPRTSYGSIFKNGKIYWAGGLRGYTIDGDDILTCEVEIRDVNTQAVTFTNLSNPTSGIEAFEKGNKIVYMDIEISLSRPSRFEMYDVLTGNWSMGGLNAALTTTSLVFSGCTVSVNNTIYVAGGYTANTAFQMPYYVQVWKLNF